MTTLIDYALMAGASYISTRAEISQFPIPSGWLVTKHANPQDGSGFEAVTFIRDGATLFTSTEIVISFAGTNPADISGDIAADLALAAGTLSDQLRQAADYYLAVKASVPEGTKITFTGHSLGGGLASLMAVMFGESATTFDQAPFLLSALTYRTTEPITGIVTTHSVAQDLRTYLAGRVADPRQLAKLDAYIAAADPDNPDPIAADSLAARGGAVTNINTQGEFLSSWFLVPSSNRIGSQGELKNSSDGVSALDLHSQALLTAFLQSGDTAASTSADHTLGQASFKLPDLLKMFFDKKLFAFDVDTKNTEDENFLEHLVRHQAGMGTSLPADRMVERFTADLWKLAQDGGQTMTDGDPGNADLHQVSNALIAFAMQAYYEDGEVAGNKAKVLFAKLDNGGIQFDITDVAVALKQAIGTGDPFKLEVEVKGFDLYFKQYLLSEAFNEQEKALINGFLPWMRDWYVQAGAGGLTATDDQNRGAFLLGGKDSDVLTGGEQADLLVGKDGNSWLLHPKGASCGARSTGKNGQNRESALKQSRREGVANDYVIDFWRIAA